MFVLCNKLTNAHQQNMFYLILLFTAMLQSLLDYHQGYMQECNLYDYSLLLSYDFIIILYFIILIIIIL